MRAFFDLYLLCFLGLLVVLQEGSLQSCSNDGQTFACFQLVGQREQTRLLHVLFCICANQHQQLGPEERRDKAKTQGRKKFLKKTKTNAKQEKS